MFAMISSLVVDLVLFRPQGQIEEASSHRTRGRSGFWPWLAKEVRAISRLSRYRCSEKVMSRCMKRPMAWIASSAEGRQENVGRMSSYFNVHMKVWSNAASPIRRLLR